MQLRVGAASDKGRVRDLNEDVYLLRADRGLFVVCDGMGGAPAGEVASQLAADAILEELNRPDTGESVSQSSDEGYLRQTCRLAEAVRRSNQCIYDRAQRDPQQAGMGATVVGAWITDHIASVVHVGDSRAYLWHEHRLERLTRDHSLVESDAGADLLDRNEALQAASNVLVRALGREPDVEVDRTEVPMRPGDYLLLCSDGLTRMVPESLLARAIVEVRDPQRICGYLVEAANRNGGADNVTVVVIEVTGNWWRRLRDRWHPARAGKRCQGSS